MTSLTDGLILHLPFSEGSGTKVLDRSKYSNHGVLTGSVFVEPFESVSEGAWIKADWNVQTTKRMKITIDSSKVDADLTNVPVYLNISISSGIGAVDVSAIFDELVAESLKLAVATFSGIQCYVEVVSWDNVGEVAELWVKVPYVSSSVDTIIYIYYDVAHANNTDFVGVTNSAVAENVWASYSAVHHMDDNPDNANVRDSTTNDNDGAKLGANEPVEAVGKIVNAQHGDGVDDIINIGADSSLNLSTGATIAFWIKATDPAGGDEWVINKGWKIAELGTEHPWVVQLGAGGVSRKLVVEFTNTVPVKYRLISDNQIPDNIYCYVVAVCDTVTNEIRVYVNGVLDGNTEFLGTIGQNTQDVLIFARNSNGVASNELIADLDEIRISPTTRTVNWITTNYENQRDNLVTFSGVEETYSKLLPDWRFGDALAFDGKNDEVNISHSSSLNPNTEITISAWINPSNIAGGDATQVICRKGTQYIFAIARASFSIKIWVTLNGILQDTVGRIVLLDDIWCHVVVTYDGAIIKLYVNGVLDASEANTGSMGNSTNALCIGRNQGFAEYFNGIMDEFRIYSRALSSQEVRLLYLRKVT